MAVPLVAVGISDVAIPLNDGGPADPLGAAKKVFAVCELIALTSCVGVQSFELFGAEGVAHRTDNPVALDALGNDETD
jgi:hypothetical protein